MAAKKKSKKPAIRHKTGFRGPSPDVGKPTRFKPGESGNPSGRPPSLLSEAYKSVLAQIVEQDPKKRTYAELIAEGQARSAIKGKTDAAREIADRTEGKAKESIELTGREGGPLDFNLTVKFIDPRENKPA